MEKDEFLLRFGQKSDLNEKGLHLGVFNQAFINVNLIFLWLKTVILEDCFQDEWLQKADNNYFRPLSNGKRFIQVSKVTLFNFSHIGYRIFWQHGIESPFIQYNIKFFHKACFQRLKQITNGILHLDCQFLRPILHLFDHSLTVITIDYR